MTMGGLGFQKLHRNMPQLNVFIGSNLFTFIYYFCEHVILSSSSHVFAWVGIGLQWIAGW